MGIGSISIEVPGRSWIDLRSFKKNVYMITVYVYRIYIGYTI